MNEFVQEIFLLADQAADAGHYGFQDACLLLTEALDKVSQNTMDSPELTLLLERWPSLVASYRNARDEAAAAIVEFLRHPLLNLELTDREFSLLETQLALGGRAQAIESAREDRFAPDEFQARDEEPDSGFQTQTAVLWEDVVATLPPQAREIVELLVLETDSLTSFLLGVTPDEPLAVADALQQLTEKTECFIRVVQTAGFEGLARICAEVGENIQVLQTNPHFFNTETQELLRTWIHLVRAYLANFTASDSAHPLIRHLCDARWPLPLSSETGAAILAQMQGLGAESSFHDEPLREQTASIADVSLQLPEDVNQELLDYLLAELPIQTQQFSAAVQGIKARAGTADLEVAQRIAHTLKGSANTVGIRAIAVLTHHLEDILVLLVKGNSLPRPALHTALLDAADCLESMSEFLVGSGPAPANAIVVLQKILDWANRIDREGLAQADGASSFGLDQDTSVADDARDTIGTDRSAHHEPSRLSSATAMVRIPSTTIEKLMRQSGESILLNGQAAERQKRIKVHLQSMDTQFVLLQQLSTDLERLIDTQEGSDLPRGTSESVLDPLEMDRYNELHTASRRMIEAAFDACEMAQDINKDVLQMEQIVDDQQGLLIDTQEAVIETRLVPVSSIAPRLQRALRQTCRLTGKQAELTLSGGESRIDQDTLNALLDPLMHLLRNAVDHGIESENERLAAGKSPGGRIGIVFDREGNTIVVSFHDDGRGLDFAAIRQAAKQRGWLPEDTEISEQELQRLILRPNFSTRTYSTQTSGRGVGLDAVYAQVVNSGGTLTLRSLAGRGLTIDLRVPLPLSRSHVLLAWSGLYRVAISSRGVEQILFGGEGEIKTIGLEQMLFAGNAIYPAVELESLLGINIARPKNQSHSFGAVLLVKTEQRVQAVLVDTITDCREVVIKNLGYYLTKIPGIVGATILGDTTVAPVLDLPELLRTPVSDRAGAMFGQPEIEAGVSRRPAVLIVDDSLSQRRALEQMLTDAGFQVRTARDGIEAAQSLAKSRPQIVLTDLEMPRMNGIELTSHIRAQTYGKTLPVIMITSRTTSKHRKMAEDAGIDRYFAKPVRDQDLLSTMQSLQQKYNQAEPV